MAKHLCFMFAERTLWAVLYSYFCQEFIFWYCAVQELELEFNQACVLCAFKG